MDETTKPKVSDMTEEALREEAAQLLSDLSKHLRRNWMRNCLDDVDRLSAVLYKLAEK